MLTKYDIITTLPYLESLNTDYFMIINDHIISGILMEISETDKKKKKKNQ